MLIVRDVVDSRVRLCGVSEIDSASWVFNSTSGKRANFVYLWKFKLQLVHVLMFRLAFGRSKKYPATATKLLYFCFHSALLTWLG